AQPGVVGNVLIEIVLAKRVIGIATVNIKVLPEDLLAIKALCIGLFQLVVEIRREIFVFAGSRLDKTVVRILLVKESLMDPVIPLRRPYSATAQTAGIGVTKPAKNTSPGFFACIGEFVQRKPSQIRATQAIWILHRAKDDFRAGRGQVEMV